MQTSASETFKVTYTLKKQKTGIESPKTMSKSCNCEKQYITCLEENNDIMRGD